MVEIYIYTHQDSFYPGGSALDINVTVENPWDRLSKIFKKYKHTIQYSPSGRYVPSNYNISVYDKDNYYYKFQYKNPNDKVKDVEIYFKSDHDVRTKAPLILGFIYQEGDSGRTGCNSNKCYYTWNHLTRRSNNVKTGTIGEAGVIKENDLVTRLLEEIGDGISRPNKLVINLNEQPGNVGVSGGRTNYPESGHYYSQGKQISVKKETSDVDGFDKYVHTIPTAGRGVDLYVGYNNNSRFFKTADGSWLGSGKVTAYFDTSTKKLVLIVFIVTGTRGAYVYKYSDFVSELKKVEAKNATSSFKEISVSGGLTSVGLNGRYQDSELQSTLEAEREKLKEAITFVNQDGLKNENISSKEENVGQGPFKKVMLKPDTDDAKEGSSVGPWKVYKNQLFSYESGKKIEGEFLGDISRSKYGSITVFYNSKNQALLVEFDEDGSSKKYFKRKNEEGNSWDGESGINTGDTRELVEKLTEIEKIIKENSSSSKADNYRSTAGRDAGIGTGVTAIFGAGAGFAIYKNFADVSAFIGRLF